VTNARILVWVALVQGGCTRLHTATLKSAPLQQYTFVADLRAETSLADAQGNVLAEPSLPPLTGHWEGRMESQAVREFQDGSIGHLVRVLDTRGPGAEPSELSGRSFELRSFDNGEVLNLGLVEHLSGPPRMGDVLLPLWTATSPTVPHIPPGEKASRNVNLPYILDHDHGIRVTEELEWTYFGAERSPAGVRAHHFSYTGRLRGDGASGLDTALQLVSLTGTCSGDLWLDTDDLSVLSHAFQWDHTVTVLRKPAPRSAIDVFKGLQAPSTTPDGAEGPWGALRQHQVLSGTVRALEGP